VARFSTLEWLSLLINGGLAVALVMVGGGRGTWRVPINQWQIVAAAVFGGVAVTALVAAPLTAAMLVVGGLVAHAVWDVVHHVRGAVVSRPYAEFCAAFDLVLAAIVLLVTL
jgi:hypothetical protein